MSELAESLVAVSSLTPRQLGVLASHLRVAAGELGLKEAAALSSKGRVKGDSRRPLSIGSYGRTVQQARENIKEAIATVFIATCLNLIKAEDVKRLLDLAQTGSKKLTEDEQEKMADLVEALLERMVL